MRSTVKKTFEAAAASGNDLLVQVKDNQPGLRQAVIALTQSAQPWECTTTVDLDRRRHTQRTVRVFAAAGLPTPWAEHIQAVVEVQRLTDTFSTQTGHWEPSRERRYYLCSRLASAQVLAQAIRGHWGIESAPQAHGKEVQDELTDCA